MIEVTADVTVSQGGVETTYPQHFFVTALDEIRGFIDAAVAHLNPADDAELSFDITWTTELAVSEADNYAITGSFAPDTATLTLDGEEQELTAEGDTSAGSLRLPEGDHEISVTPKLCRQGGLGRGIIEPDMVGGRYQWPRGHLSGRCPGADGWLFAGLAETINSVGDWIAESGAFPLDFGPSSPRRP